MGSLLTLARLAILSAFAASLVALGLGRWCRPEPEGRSFGPAAPIYVALRDWAGRGEGPYFLEPAGDLGRLELPTDERLEQVGLSPWVDASGARQAVGRWSAWAGSGPGRVVQGSGLGRFRYPDGQPLNRVESDVVPAAPPCWLPGRAARLIFAGVDGRLYRFDFERSEGREADPDGCDRAPIPLAWEPEAAEATGPAPWVADLTPAGAGLPADLYLASIRLLGRWESGAQYGSAHLWWLRIDAAGRTVLAAGRVDVSEGSGDRSDRFPVLAATSGGLVLAYLRQEAGGRPWRLHVAPARLVAGAGVAADPAADRDAAGPCFPTAPIVGPDGRWVACVTIADGRPRILRAPWPAL